VSAALPPCESLADLAVFGGTPAFAAPVHVGRPNIGDQERVLKRVKEALDRHWLTNGGVLVEEFEQRVAELTGAEHCIAVCNATIGIQLAAKALGLTGEVIVPSYTFIGTAHALSWIGLEPRFCEIDPITHTIDVDAVERAITPRTSAILGVHLWGRPCDIEGLQDVARRHDLTLFFDAAHALGCSRGETPIGSFGQCEVFSFHATKVASAAEGGAITTNDAELARRLRLARNFGFAGYDYVVDVGTNAKMSELSAALGLSTLEQLGDFVARNRRNHNAYESHFEGIPGVRLSSRQDSGRHNFHYVVFETDPDIVNRDDLTTMLHAENVLARRYFYPGCHRLEPYAGAALSLPVTERLAAAVMVMPTGGSVTEDDIAEIAKRVRVAASDGAEFRARLLERGKEPLWRS
jgi:dTDP-4-amino-4,6-dideoxygalactose transaminase